MKLTILGCRGSVPAGGHNFLKYGSDTSCYLVETDEQAVFLDAGSGIARVPDVGGREISIILSHFHLDHILGLTFFPYLGRNIPIRIYAPCLPEVIKKRMDHIFTPPFWPVTLSEYPADISYEELKPGSRIGDIEADTMEGNHPDGSAVIRLSAAGKSLVYASDYEYTEEGLEDMARFCHGADLIIYDGQYTEEEYVSHRGYGHSTKESGIRLLDMSGSGQIIFTHHDPFHDDEFLDRESERIGNINPRALLAFSGMEINL